ncbi:hypothetical protein SS50377_24691 [Spironucleus salmonicida]|uniref:Uncharacterized protein n=1 Tax=Spironucleus salmonicida TaxID=348837 RepID=V6LUL2_9EUKA|nr:hypothetical protein SS50377_24691 [Spironucleus salmonicida]|eukprot:EST44499.1 Hypothetical protein SS50377_ja038 [Spironucleus salmonicida]
MSFMQKGRTPGNFYNMVDWTSCQTQVAYKSKWNKGFVTDFARQRSRDEPIFYVGNESWGLINSWNSCQSSKITCYQPVRKPINTNIKKRPSTAK